ncbi:MAG: type II and III secretion system protein family protein [Bryobacteraceae bacterium]
MSASFVLAVGVCAALTQQDALGQQIEELKLTVGKSIVLDYPTDIRQISTSDPAVVDTMAVTTREMLLSAKAAGTSTIIVWSKTGQRSIYAINVEQNLEPLRRLIKETFPKEEIQVQSTRDSLSLTGRVSSKDIGDRAVAMVSPFAKTVVNYLMLPVAAVDRQIVLKVKFAELDRTKVEQLGVNIISTGATNTVGAISTGQFSSSQVSQIGGGVPTRFTITDALNVFAFRPDLNIGAFIKALQQESVLQILAEPNLVTTNGKEASFLVGGEFPIPVLQGGGNAGAVTIQFREFGIRLTFNPILTENNTIKMYVKPEVSTIDTANGVNISGFFIPALSTRRMETNIELGQGQSFIIGGLIDDRVSEQLSKTPGLANIPLLGALFKSKDEKRNRTELVVIVSPEIVKPYEPGDRIPQPFMPKEFLAPMPPADGSNTSSAAPVKPSRKSKAAKAAASTEPKSKG